MNIKQNPASFRDPRGHVYHHEDRILRTVTSKAKEDFEFVQASGLYEKLIAEQKLLPQAIVDKNILSPVPADISYLLEHPKLAFISYPYEWPFSALQAAALLHLKIQLQALDYEITLTDASAYNIQFQGPQPIFIDHLAFCRYQPGMLWSGYRQFCEQFLNPLLLHTYLATDYHSWYRGNLSGITTAELQRLLPLYRKLSPKVFLNIVLPAYLQKTSNQKAAKVAKNTQLPLPTLKNLLLSLKNWIENLAPAKNTKTIWNNYIDDPHHVEKKSEFVCGFINEVKPNLLFDLGCNSGDYAMLALNNGAKQVIGFDGDHAVLEKAFNKAKDINAMFLPLYMNLDNPSPNQGWGEAERSGFSQRGKADAMLALALLHHLVIAKNIPLQQLITWLIELAPQGVIEFVPKKDLRVQELLCLREDIFSDYTYENCLFYIKQVAVVVKECKVSDSGRMLIWYRKNVIC